MATEPLTTDRDLNLAPLDGMAAIRRRLAAVLAAHLLQAHDVGVKLLHRKAQVVDFKTPCRPQALHAFVDVVGGDFECFHVLRISVPQYGSRQQSLIKPVNAQKYFHFTLGRDDHLF